MKRLSKVIKISCTCNSAIGTNTYIGVVRRHNYIYTRIISTGEKLFSKCLLEGLQILDSASCKRVTF